MKNLFASFVCALGVWEVSLTLAHILYPDKTMFKLLYLDPSTPLHLPNSYTIFEYLVPDTMLCYVYIGHHVNVMFFTHYRSNIIHRIWIILWFGRSSLVRRIRVVFDRNASEWCKDLSKTGSWNYMTW